MRGIKKGRGAAGHSCMHTVFVNEGFLQGWIGLLDIGLAIAAVSRCCGVISSFQSAGPWSADLELR